MITRINEKWDSISWGWLSQNTFDISIASAKIQKAATKVIIDKIFNKCMYTLDDTNLFV